MDSLQRLRKTKKASFCRMWLKAPCIASPSMLSLVVMEAAISKMHVKPRYHRLENSLLVRAA